MAAVLSQRIGIRTEIPFQRVTAWIAWTVNRDQLRTHPIAIQLLAFLECQDCFDVGQVLESKEHEFENAKTSRHPKS